MRAFFISGLVWFMGLVPPRLAPLVARPLAWLIWHLSKRLRTVSLVNLGLCYPDMPEDERERVARSAMRHYVRSGLETGIAWFWPRRRFVKQPGTIVLEILPPVPAGLSRQDFMRTLQERIEPATAKLEAEGVEQLRAHGAASAAAEPL